MPTSLHDSDSEVPTRDHDSCVSFQEFRSLKNMVRDMAEDMRVIRDALMVSTPDRGCVIDNQRKHEAQIQALQSERATSFGRKLLETAATTVVQVSTALLLALLAKGLVVSIVTEALKLAGGTK